MMENARTKIQLLKGKLNQRFHSMTSEKNGQGRTIHNLHIQE